MQHEISALLDIYARRMELPVVGVSIGRKDDRSTWRLQFSDAATQNDRDKEAGTIQDFDEGAETILATQAVADAQVNDPVIAALITVLSSATTHTAEELRALVKTQLLDQ